MVVILNTIFFNQIGFQILTEKISGLFILTYFLYFDEQDFTFSNNEVAYFFYGKLLNYNDIVEKTNTIFLCGWTQHS